MTYVPACEPGVTYVESQPARVVYVERPAPVRVVRVVERPRVVYVRPNYGYGHGQRPREVVYYAAPRDCDRGW